MTLKLVIDRFEENIGVCLDNENKRHHIPKETLGNLKVNDIFNIEFDGEIYHSPVFLADETAQTTERISQKMKRLYNMGKHRRPPKL